MEAGLIKEFFLTRNWTDNRIMGYVEKAWCALYNGDTITNPDHNRLSRLMKDILCLNSWIDDS